jgi:hypothetical protein
MRKREMDNRVKLDPLINELVRFKLHESPEMYDATILSFDETGYWVRGGSLCEYLKSCMRLFTRLFVASFIVELSFLGATALSRSYHPLLQLPIDPAILVAMGIGGVHSAGFLSVAFGLTVAAFFYALLLWVFIKAVYKLYRRRTTPVS